jgi:lysophospholipase L1-like esterase
MRFFVRLWLAVALLILPLERLLGAETNHNFAVWENAISAFERMDATNPPPKGAIEFIGSSGIARWDTLARDFPGKPVFNRGFGGSEIADSTHFADRIVLPYAPAKIFFRAGGNDLWAGKSPAQVFADFQAFASLVHVKLPATEIYFIGWNPTPSRWKQHEAEKTLNTFVADFVRDKPWLKYIETYDLPLDAAGQPRPELFVTDQLHFNAAGYQLLAARVRPFVTGSTKPAATNGTAK